MRSVLESPDEKKLRNNKEMKWYATHQSLAPKFKKCLQKPGDPLWKATLYLQRFDPLLSHSCRRACLKFNVRSYMNRRLSRKGVKMDVFLKGSAVWSVCRDRAVEPAW